MHNFEFVQRLASRWAHHHRIGRWPSLRNPKTFNEKILAFKHFERPAHLAELADKVIVKQHVADLLGEGWIIPTLYSGEKLPEKRLWDTPYIVKTNNSAARSISVISEEEEDWDNIRARMHAWVSEPHPPISGEWIYTQIKPQILVEPFVCAPEGPVDFSFLMINGKVDFIMVKWERQPGKPRALFDAEWNRLPLSWVKKLQLEDFPRPDCLEELVGGAEQLSRKFGSVRIDLYDVDGRPKFGEITMTPGAGVFPFFPDSHDFELGAKIPWPPKYPGPPKPGETLL